MTTRLTYSAPVTFADGPRRLIGGRVVTYDETGSTSIGPARFAAGSITVPDDAGTVRLVREHDETTPVGRAVAFTIDDDGIDGEFRIAATRAGDDALAEAAEGLRDGLSVGVRVDEAERDADGVLVILSAVLEHVGHVTRPAINSARVDRVAAAHTEGNTAMAHDPEDVDGVDESPEDAVDTVEAAHRPAPIRTAPRVAPVVSDVDRIVLTIRASQGDRDAALRLRAADQKLADNPPQVPTPVVGNLIDTMNADRPIIASARRLPLPAAGKTFQRPTITQHVLVGEQSGELVALDSQKMTTAALDVVKRTFGGSLRISFQDRDWTDPGILALILADFDTVYARTTEAAAATELQTATGHEVLAARTDPAVVLKALYPAAAKVKTAAGQMPDVLYAGVTSWTDLGSLSDTAKRPVFPTLAPANAPGQMRATSLEANPLGLRLIVSTDLPADYLAVGYSQALEWYENGPATLQDVDVTALGVVVAKYGYAAGKLVLPGAVVELSPTAPTTK
jgi:HK97 family phage prohead protease